MVQRQDSSGGIQEFTINPNTDASGDNRIDRIVLEWSSADQVVRLKKLEGTVDPSPTPPALTQDATIWQVPIAQVLATNGFLVITDSDITQESEPAIITPRQHGGTGLNTDYAAREMLIGNTDGSNDLTKFIQKHARLNWSANSSNVSGGAWGDVDNLQIVSDPDSLITLGSTQDIQVSDDGLYFFAFSGQIRNNGGSNERCAVAIYNDTQAIRTIMRQENTGSGSALYFGSTAFAQGDADDVFNLQLYPISNNFSIEGNETTFGTDDVSEAQLDVFKLTNEAS